MDVRAAVAGARIDHTGALGLVVMLGMGPV